MQTPFPIGRLDFMRLRAVCLAMGLMALCRPAFSLPPLPLHTSGNQLCDSTGNPVRLKGVNICSVEWLNGGDHVLQSVAESIAHWHATIIRFPITQDRWEGKMPDDDSGPDQSDGGEAYRKLVDSVVEAASEAGVYLIVDLHWSDMGEWGRNVAQHNMPDGNTALAWAAIAARYANNPAVLFDAYNEPHGVTWPVWRNGGRVKERDGTYDSPGMQGLVDVIRKTGSQNVIVIGGLDFSFDLRGIAAGYAIAGPNILYSCHVYPSKSPDWDGHVSAAARIAPVLIGEFGADGFSTEAASFTPRVLRWIDEHQYSAVAWCMHTTAGPALISDWNYDPTFGYGTYVLSWMTGGAGPPPRLGGDGGPGRIALSWQPVPGASNYAVYRSQISLGEGAVAPIATGVTGAGYTDAGLSNGATFYYQVTATGPAGVSGPSNERGAIAGTPGGFDAPTPTFSFVATVPSGAAPPHVPVSIAVTASETGKAAGKRILITMQVHDEKGSLVYQKMVEHQDFSPGQSHAYAFTWTPDEEGTYTIQAGAFGDGFAPRYSWDDHAAVLVVGASGPK